MEKGIFLVNIVVGFGDYYVGLVLVVGSLVVLYKKV